MEPAISKSYAVQMRRKRHKGREMAQGEEIAGDERPARSERRDAVQNAELEQRRTAQNEGRACDGDQRRHAEKPGWAEHQQIAQMAPAVAPWAQMGSALAKVYRKCRWRLVDPDVLERGFDHHLAREFHSVAAEIEFAKRVFGDCAQPAMCI